MDYFPTAYQSVIYKTRYSRWMEDQQRREEWPETVGRYTDFMFDRAKREFGFEDEVLKQEVYDNILNLQVMPSMRALMTAGPALARSNIAGYNCAYLAVDEPIAFDEALYILMNGTGVGFSVERQYTDKLPTVPEEFDIGEGKFLVGDSKEGWAEALRYVVLSLYSGIVPDWDLSDIRPKGARLNTFGGRASGPQPLDDLLNFVVKTFVTAQGRKLTPLECHEVMCKVGDIVVVGGVRRAALISLSDLSDDAMRDAKSGSWWEEKGHLRLANNSAVYMQKPDRATFDKEWAALRASGSGERGMFSRYGAQKKAALMGRELQDFGVNPCVPDYTWVMTSDGPRKVGELINTATKVIVDGKKYEATGFWSTGIKQVLRVSLSDGRKIDLTGNHKVMTDIGWVEAQNLSVGDSVVLHNHRGADDWGKPDQEQDGYLLGSLVGDGTFGVNARIVSWNSEEDHESRQYIEEGVRSLGHRSDFSGWVDMTNGEVKIETAALTELARSYDIVKGNKTVTDELERSSSSLYRGFLAGLFDADGSVQGTQLKGVSVRYHQSDEIMLRAIQRMFGRLGINSTLYQRSDAGYKSLPDGHGGHKDYWTKASYDLVISNDSILEFEKQIPIKNIKKAARLAEAIGNYKRAPNRDKFQASVVSVEELGEMEVFDATVDEVHAFDADGVYVHNCGEIILRNKGFCNLSSVVIRPRDTEETLREKVRIATVIGTLQSSLTKFPYLSEKWTKNAEEERLLGVSIGGVFNNPLMYERGRGLEQRLETLRDYTVAVNRQLAHKLGINPSASITTVKPEGNSSQLNGVSSGIHPWHDKYYIRNIRGNEQDPVSKFMEFYGVKTADDVMSDSTKVFSFPIEAPEAAKTRDELTAIEHLEIWLTYSESWAHHNPSVTVNIRDNEWDDVADWVYDHFDRVVGVSFLPYSDHTYQQAPYEECTIPELFELQEKTPETLPWELLSVFELEDSTTGTQAMACMAGGCSVEYI